MRDIATKANDIGDTLDATDFNASQNELENAVTSAGFTLDPAGGADTNLNMLGQTIAIYAEAGQWYSDSGSVNAYALARSTNLKNPTSYSDGMTVAFLPANTNTSASTVNVASLGAKSIVRDDGSALVAGDIAADTIIRMTYVSSDGKFRIASGGALNADTLDGLDSTQFLRSDTDDIMVGHLAVSGTLMVGTADANNADVDLEVVNVADPRLDVCTNTGASRKSIYMTYDTTADRGKISVYDYGGAANGELILIGDPIYLNNIATEYVEIGVWDMDTNATNGVAHGQDISTIISVQVLIQKDDGNYLYPLNYAGTAGTSQGWFYVGTSNVQMSRLGSGFFDSTDFNSGVLNRGYIVIQHTQ